MRIYFDNAATAPVDPEVLEAILPYFTEKFGNPSSIHSFGQETALALDRSREKCAEIINAKPNEIIFTGGATESNNLAILGLAEKFKAENPHFVTSKIEHPSVLETMNELKKRGFAIDFVKVDKQGIIDVAELKKSIKKNTVLVSIMYANNEVGSIQPVEEIAKAIKQEKNKRKKTDLPVYFHTDAAQAFNYLSCKTDYLNCDLMTLSGQKIFGPKGIGLLYLKENTQLKPIHFGGHQEFGFRPGTINVPLIAGMAKAMETAEKDRAVNIKKVKGLVDKIWDNIRQIKNIQLNGSPENRLPNNLNVSFKNVEGESVLMMLDMEGIAVSTGSACTSGSLEPSHVLSAMGVKPEWTHGSIRISLGKFNTEIEVNRFIKVLPPIIEKLRDMAPK